MLRNNEGFDGAIAGDEGEEEGMVVRNPSMYTFDTANPMSECEMNTEKVIIKSTAMKFGQGRDEGGWPKEVDPTEKQDTKRFITKACKQEEYKDSVMHMGPIIERCMKQNGTTDIYEEYYADLKDEDHSSTPPSMKAIAVMKDVGAPFYYCVLFLVGALILMLTTTSFFPSPPLPLSPNSPTT